MTKETKIGLLVGLAFIILFAIILSEKGPANRGGANAPSFTIVDAGKTAGSASPSGQPLKDAGKLPVDSQLEPIVKGKSNALPPGPVTMQEEKVAQAPTDDEPIDQLPDTLTALLKARPDGFEPVRKSEPAKVETARHEEPPQSSRGQAESMTAKVPQPKSEAIEESKENAGSLAAEKEAELASADRAKTESKATPLTIKTEHVIQPGESLGKIAAKYYGRSTPARVEAIYTCNRDTLSSVSAVKAGEKLRIPDLGEHNGQFEPAPSFVLNELHNPKKQEPSKDTTLRIPAPIGERMTVAAAERSGKTASKKPVTPVSAKSEPAKPAGFAWYEIRKGDTLSKIARKELGNEKFVHEISKLNKDKISDRRNLKPGTKIRLPSKTALIGESDAVLTTRGLENAEP